MKSEESNFAFIDSQNVYRGVQDLGWKIDWNKFRRYLKEKHSITTAFMFIGYIKDQADLYTALQKSGFVLVFKPTLPDGEGRVKGNCDADMVLQAMIELPNYDKALIVSSDGDFYSLVKYLKGIGKLKYVLSPVGSKCSKLLKTSAQELILYMDKLEHKIGYK